MTAYLDFIGPDDVLPVDRSSHLLPDVFYQVLSRLVLIDQDVDLLGYGVVILGAEVVDAGLDVVYILFPIVLVDVSAF